MLRILTSNSSANADAKLKQFAEDTPTLFAELDANLRYVTCNSRYAEWFGVDAASLAGRTIGSVLSEEVFSRIRPHYERALAGEQVQFERVHRFADGRNRHLSITLVPYREHGKIVGVSSFGVDASDTVTARNELKLVSKRLDLLMDSANVATWDWDFEQDFVLLHGRWRELLGASVERAFHPADKLWASAHPEDSERVREQFKECTSGMREQLDIEMRLRGKGGEWVWIRTVGRVSERSGGAEGTGRTQRMLGTMTDVSRLKAAQLSSADHEKCFRSLIELTSDWYWETDTQHRVTRIEGYNGYAGFETVKQSAIGKTRWELHKSALDDAAWARHRAVLDSFKPFELTYRTIGPSGANTWVELKGVPDFDVRHQFLGYHGSGRDVTREVESKRHIAYLAQHDMLTGLVNRDQFARLLDRAINEAGETGQMLAIAYLDVDHFKHINDAFGHNIGDAVLRELAARMNRLLPGKASVGRVGGDEFIVYMPGIASLEAAFEFGETLAAAASQPMNVLHTQTVATVSVGMAIFPEHGAEADLLMNQADIALHEAKTAGRNCCMMFTPEMRERANMARNLEAQLRRAIVAGEFTLAWQPRVELATGRWEGAEALLRWPAAQQLKIGIQQVIEVAERAGLINDIGLWVAQSVCDQLEAWQKIGLTHFCGGLNVSVHQLGDERLFTLLRERLKRLAPRTLEIEITESTLLQEIDVTLPLLQELRSMGVRIAMDDFGSGYSHFAQLRRMPIDVIKVDKSLVDDIATDPQARALVEAVRALGKGLGMEMVAEGVEHQEQADVLLACGFEYGQGYLWQRPCPAAELLEGIRRSSAQ